MSLSQLRSPRFRRSLAHPRCFGGVCLIVVALFVPSACNEKTDDPAASSTGDASESTATESTGGSDEDPFNFFLTSLGAMQTLSGSADGFGGNYGGIAGADSICNETAKLAGVMDKTWVAFLSATTGGSDGGPLHAIDRIGDGPFYDRNGRLVAASKADLLHPRPMGDPQAISDLSDELGIPGGLMGDFHDVITGSDATGRLANSDPSSTCDDWTNADDVPNNTVMCGHSWPRGGGTTDGDVHWLAAHPVPGCAPGIAGASSGDGGNCIGCAGGYGALYCFAVDNN